MRTGTKDRMAKAAAGARWVRCALVWIMAQVVGTVNSVMPCALRGVILCGHAVDAVM